TQQVLRVPADQPAVGDGDGGALPVMRPPGVDEVEVVELDDAPFQWIAPHAAQRGLDQLAAIDDDGRVAVDAVAGPGDQLGQRSIAHHQQDVAFLQRFDSGRFHPAHAPRHVDAATMPGSSRPVPVTRLRPACLLAYSAASARSISDSAVSPGSNSATPTLRLASSRREPIVSGRRVTEASIRSAMARASASFVAGSTARNSSPP